MEKLKLQRYWYKIGPLGANIAPHLKDLHLEIRLGPKRDGSGEEWAYVYHDGMPVWNCNAGFFRARFFQVKTSGKIAA